VHCTSLYRGDTRRIREAGERGCVWITLRRTWDTVRVLMGCPRVPRIQAPETRHPIPNPYFVNPRMVLYPWHLNPTP